MASVVLVALAAAAYCGMSLRSIHGPTGGSFLGLLFGIVGSAFMVFAALLAIRRRLPTWRIGSAQAWLRGHLWLGTVGFVLILFHAGFGWGGLLENLLWISFGLVVVTGFLGVGLQQVIPRLLMSEVPLETMAAQIPSLTKMSVFKADKIVAGRVGVLELDYESLKDSALDVLKRQEQAIGERPEDFPREHAKTYANVPIPESDKKKPAAAAASAPSDASATKAEPAAPAAKPKSPLDQMRNKAPAQPAAEAAAKSKSPVELMREKTAAKSAASEPAKTPTPAPAPVAPAPEMMLSMLEEFQGTKALAQPVSLVTVKPTNRLISITCAQCGATFKVNARHAGKMGRCTNEECKAPYQVPFDSEPAAASPEIAPVAAPSPAAAATTPAAAPAKKLSPLEQMKAKAAAAPAAAPAPSGESAPAKPLSPMEQMQAKKLAAAQAASGAAKPLTAEKPAAAPPVAKKAAPAPKSKAKAEALIPQTLLDEFREFHIKIVRPFLFQGKSPQHRLDDTATARRLFAQLRSDLPAELHDSIQQIEDLCEERRQFNTQLRLHHWLHWWLIVHIPSSIALLVLFVVHVVVSLRVVPFGR
jgi:hypothetical protein